MLAGQQGKRAVILEFHANGGVFGLFTPFLRSQDGSDDAVLLRLGDFAATMRPTRTHRPPARHRGCGPQLAWPAAGTFDKNIHARAERRLVERILLRVQQMLQRLEPVRFDVFGNLKVSPAAGVPGRGLYLKE